MKKHKIAILVSGSGSNMEALIKHSLTEESSFEISQVISNKKDALAIEKAHNYGIKTAVVDRKEYSSKSAHEKAILDQLSTTEVDCICLAGYMQLLSKEFIDCYKNKILNIHPSLLPLFPGLDTHNKALSSGMKIAGCTVHIVTEIMDDGPIIGQAVVPIFNNDDADTLQKRILKVEHSLYSKAVEKYLNSYQSSLIAEEANLIVI